MVNWVKRGLMMKKGIEWMRATFEEDVRRDGTKYDDGRPRRMVKIWPTYCQSQTQRKAAAAHLDWLPNGATLAITAWEENVAGSYTIGKGKQTLNPDSVKWLGDTY